MVHGITTNHETDIKDMELTHYSAILANFSEKMQRQKYSRYIPETDHIMFL